MKRILISLAVVCLGAIAAFAGMDSVTYTADDLVGNKTNSASVILRGTIEGIYVDVTAGTTCDVVVSTAQMTIFTNRVTSDTYFAGPFIRGYDTSGTAIGLSSGTNTCMTKIAVAGAVTVKHVGGMQSGTTNDYATTIFYNK